MILYLITIINMHVCQTIVATQRHTKNEWINEFNRNHGVNHHGRLRLAFEPKAPRFFLLRLIRRSFGGDFAGNGRPFVCTKPALANVTLCSSIFLSLSEKRIFSGLNSLREELINPLGVLQNDMCTSVSVCVITTCVCVCVCVCVFWDKWTG